MDPSPRHKFEPVDVFARFKVCHLTPLLVLLQAEYERQALLRNPALPHLGLTRYPGEVLDEKAANKRAILRLRTMARQHLTEEVRDKSPEELQDLRLRHNASVRASAHLDPLKRYKYGRDLRLALRDSYVSPTYLASPTLSGGHPPARAPGLGCSGWPCPRKAAQAERARGYSEGGHGHPRPLGGGRAPVRGAQCPGQHQGPLCPRM